MLFWFKLVKLHWLWILGKVYNMVLDSKAQIWLSPFSSVMLKKTLESPLDCKEIQPVHPKWNQSWIFTGRTDAEVEAPVFWPPDVKDLIHWKRLWCWERLKAGGEGDDRGWDGWMASPTRRTWVWVSSRSWWWTGKPGVLQSVGSQRVGHDWVTALTDTSFFVGDERLRPSHKIIY